MNKSTSETTTHGRAACRVAVASLGEALLVDERGDELLDEDLDGARVLRCVQSSPRVPKSFSLSLSLSVALGASARRPGRRGDGRGAGDHQLPDVEVAVAVGVVGVEEDRHGPLADRRAAREGTCGGAKAVTHVTQHDTEQRRALQCSTALSLNNT